MNESINYGALFSALLPDGALVYSQDAIREEQRDWDELDGLKDFDFSTHQFWIVTDNGVVEGFDSVKEYIARHQAT